jgi:hypothetical protein
MADAAARRRAPYTADGGGRETIMHGIASALLLVGAFAAVAVLAALLAMRLLRTTRGVTPAGQRPDA